MNAQAMMNPEAIKEIKARNEEANARETKVNTVDNMSSAGQGKRERNVDVVHQPHPYPNTSGGALVSAAAAVASTLRSAKEAISKND